MFCCWMTVFCGSTVFGAIVVVVLCGTVELSGDGVMVFGD